MFLKRLIYVIGLSVLMIACQTNSNEIEPVADNKDKGLKLNCTAPPPVKDIWKLEPMLIKKGLIHDEMSQEQREKTIKEYIRTKNASYENCGKGA